MINKADDITVHEEKVLKWINGDVELEVTGAWTNTCIGFLKKNGYLEGVFDIKVTEKGKNYLDKILKR